MWGEFVQAVKHLLVGLGLEQVGFVHGSTLPKTGPANIEDLTPTPSRLYSFSHDKLISWECAQEGREEQALSVSYENSKLIIEGIKSVGVKSVSALPETWLVYLLQRLEDDPDVELMEVAKEEEAIGIAAGAYFAGVKHILLMQNHGFLAAINGIVSLAQLYSIPLCMLIAFRGHWGEPYPWHTKGGIITEEVLRALKIPFEYAREPSKVAKQIREAYTFSQSSLSPVALLLTRDLMED